RFADAVEGLLERPAVPARQPLPAPLVRRALRPAAAASARRAERLRKAKPPKAWPARDLQRRVHRLARDARPVVAGPWVGDETGELLYWIPFLRWAQTATVGLGERLHVVRRPETACWYDGIGVAQAAAQEELGLPDDVLLLPPDA